MNRELFSESPPRVLVLVPEVDFGQLHNNTKNMRISKLRFSCNSADPMIFERMSVWSPFNVYLLVHIHIASYLSITLLVLVLTDDYVAIAPTYLTTYLIICCPTSDFVLIKNIITNRSRYLYLYFLLVLHIRTFYYLLVRPTLY